MDVRESRWEKWESFLAQQRTLIQSGLREIHLVSNGKNWKTIYVVENAIARICKARWLHEA